MLTSWKLEDGRIINLLTPTEYEELLDNTELITISGQILIKGKDYIDQDTRFGLLAVGVLI